MLPSQASNWLQARDSRTGDSSLFNFKSQVLRCQGLIGGVKERILKPRTFVLWTPRKEHTESAIHKDHLAPSRFKCWMNQILIGISQPLAQLKRHYNVEIPRVSLPDDRLKWDFRTDSVLKPWIFVLWTPHWHQEKKTFSFIHWQQPWSGMSRALWKRPGSNPGP